MPQGRFGPAHYRAIHKHLFPDVYAWAGRDRTVRTSKQGNAFCFPEHIERNLKKLFEKLQKPPFTGGRPFEEQIFWFEHASHEMQQDQPGTVFLHLVQDIRPIAVRVGDAAPDDAPGIGGG